MNKTTKNRTLDKRDPPPLTVSYAPSGMRAPPFTYLLNEKKNEAESTQVVSANLKKP
jgi:hypothetical protein